MLSRRDFLRSSTLIALAPAVPGFLARTARAARPQRDARTLVVVQLDGGNDGINTVVPFKDEGYAKHRRGLRLPKERLLKVNDAVGLHFAMTEAGKLLEAGQLAVVQGVGYPNPNRSHFESMAIWHTARPKKADRHDLGWLGLAFDEQLRTGHGVKPAEGVPASVYVGAGELPVALRGRRAVASALTRPEDFVLDPKADPRKVATPPLTLPSPPGGEGRVRGGDKDDLSAFVRRHALDAYATADRMAEVVKAGKEDAGYPPTDLAAHLRLIARLMKADTGTRVFYARQGGYDTHAGQFATHQQLLSELSGALGAFLKDLSAAKLAERVTVLCFSEFGRTVKENGSAGTDHGTSGPVFLAGPGVKPGLVGATPSLTDLDPKHGDLRTAIDFRQVYAGVLEDWLGLPAKEALGADFERPALFKKT